MATEILIKGVPSRGLPQVQSDNQREGIPARVSRYGEGYYGSIVRKEHLLADEGSYFVANNGQTGILSSPAVGFVATTPAAIIINGDSAGNPAAKRIYLSYLDMLVSTAGVDVTAVQSKQMAIVLDNVNRYTSGGTNLTPNIVSPNMDIAVKSIASAYFGALLSPAASAMARTLVGLRQLRMPVTSTTAPDLVGDRIRLEFGGVEPVTDAVVGSTSLVQANAISTSLKLPPVIIGPGQCCLIYIWQLTVGGSVSSATQYAPEFGWWER